MSAHLAAGAGDGGVAALALGVAIALVMEHQQIAAKVPLSSVAVRGGALRGHLGIVVRQLAALPGCGCECAEQGARGKVGRHRSKQLPPGG